MDKLIVSSILSAGFLGFMQLIMFTGLVELNEEARHDERIREEGEEEEESAYESEEDVRIDRGDGNC